MHGVRRRADWSIFIVAAALALAGCDGTTPTLNEAPESSVVSGYPSAGTFLATVRDVPALPEMDLPPSPRPWDIDPATLDSVLSTTGGRASVAFKAPDTRRTLSATGGTTRKEAVPASAIREGLTFLADLGVGLKRYSARLGVAHAVIPPNLGPTVAASPIVDWVEPKLQAQDRLLGSSRAMRRPLTAETRPWGVDTIRAPSAWSRADGSGVVVMVIDSGHDQGHEDLPDVPTGNCDWGAGNGGCVDDDPAGWHGTGVAYNAMGPWVDIFGDFTIKPNQQDCVFSADVEGGYGSMSYKWYKNGDLDGTDDQYITSTGSSGSFELKLTVTDGQGVSKSRIRWVQIDSGGVECFF